MVVPRAIVLSGYGLNCEEETKFAFELAGARADIVHINDLIADPKRLEAYQIMALPGGFSYCDDTGAGNAFASRMKSHLEAPIRRFIEQDHLLIGICNGFQIISNMGLVPAISKSYGARSMALTRNDNARYIDRWVDVAPANHSPWLAGLDKLAVPIAHGEGRLFADDIVLADLRERNLIAIRYERGEMCEYLELPANPNGSADDIAGVTDETGRVLGLMPHPERAVFFTQLPNWPVLAELARRNHQEVPEFGPGLAVFANSVAYFAGW